MRRYARGRKCQSASRTCHSTRRHLWRTVDLLPPSPTRGLHDTEAGVEIVSRGVIFLEGRGESGRNLQGRSPHIYASAPGAARLPPEILGKSEPSHYNWLGFGPRLLKEAFRGQEFELYVLVSPEATYNLGKQNTRIFEDDVDFSLGSVCRTREYYTLTKIDE